jgi:hypothetical protein
MEGNGLEIETSAQVDGRDDVLQGRYDTRCRGRRGRNLLGGRGGSRDTVGSDLSVRLVSRDVDVRSALRVAQTAGCDELEKCQSTGEQ